MQEEEEKDKMKEMSEQVVETERVKITAGDYVATCYDLARKTTLDLKRLQDWKKLSRKVRKEK